MGIEFPAFDGLEDEEVRLVHGAVELYSTMNKMNALGISLNYEAYSKVDLDRVYIIHKGYLDAMKNRS